MKNFMIILMALSVFSCMPTNLNTPALNDAVWNNIRHGMTYDEVYNIVGAPTGVDATTFENQTQEVWIWYINEKTTSGYAFIPIVNTYNPFGYTVELDAKITFKHGRVYHLYRNKRVNERWYP